MLLLGLSFFSPFGVGLSGCVRRQSLKYEEVQAGAGAEPGYYSRAGAPARGSSAGEAVWPSSHALKRKVLMLDFWNDTPIQLLDFGSFAGGEVRKGLRLSERVLLADGPSASSLKTSDFVESNRIRVAHLVRQGQTAGVPIIGIGRIVQLSAALSSEETGLLRNKETVARADLEVKLFDTLTGREMLGVQKIGRLSDRVFTVFQPSQTPYETDEHRGELLQGAIREAVAALLPELVQAIEKTTWEGRIVKVRGHQVFINAGAQSGLASGDILRVLHPGEDIYDPLTGAYLGRSVGLFKGTLEVLSFVGGDGAMASIHTGGQFLEGDLVQMY
jgi:hypothetical protein